MKKWYNGIALLDLGVLKMSYLEAIKVGFFVFPILAFLFTIPFILWQYHKYGSIHKLRVLIIYSFILYMICVYFLAIFPLPDRDSIDMNSNVCQLIPFMFINDIIKESFQFESIFDFISNSSVYTVLFNILMFIPFGVYLRYYFKSSFKKTLLLSFLFSLFLEVTQLTGLYFIYPHPYRLFDVDDLIINTLGGIIGYFVASLLMKFLPSRDNIDLSSIEEGKKVSGLRRATRFCLDAFIFIFFTGILRVFINNDRVIYLSLIIYYVVISFMCKGQTFGSKFLNMRLEFADKGLFRLFLRLILVILYYVIVPFGLGYVFLFLTRNLSDILVFVLGALYIILVGIFYLVSFMNIFKRKVLIYDSLSGLRYVSTIGLEKCDEEDKNG